MSQHEYMISRELDMQDVPFYALIMAAMRKADTTNLGKLKMAFPTVWIELERRYHAPGGRLPEDERPPYAPFTPEDPETCTCVDPHSICPKHG